MGKALKAKFELLLIMLSLSLALFSYRQQLASLRCIFFSCLSNNAFVFFWSPVTVALLVGKVDPSEKRLVPMFNRVQSLLEHYFAINDKFPISSRQVQKAVKEIALKVSTLA
jgi:hypothetical protein